MKIHVARLKVRLGKYTMVRTPTRLSGGVLGKDIRLLDQMDYPRSSSAMKSRHRASKST